MPKNTKKALSSGIFQFLLVTVSVWLALMASDWSENRKKRDDTQLLLTKLQAELEVNLEKLKTVSTYYHTLDDSIKVNIPKEKREINSVSFYNFWKGKIEPEFQDYVFQLALVTGKMNDIYLEFAMSLMELYKSQQIFAEILDIYDQEGWQEKNTLERMDYLSSLTHDIDLHDEHLESKIVKCLEMADLRTDK